MSETSLTSELKELQSRFFTEVEEALDGGSPLVAGALNYAAQEIGYLLAKHGAGLCEHGKPASGYCAPCGRIDPA